MDPSMAPKNLNRDPKRRNQPSFRRLHPPSPMARNPPRKMYPCQIFQNKTNTQKHRYSANYDMQELQTCESMGMVEILSVSSIFFACWVGAAGLVMFVACSTVPVPVRY